LSDPRNFTVGFIERTFLMVENREQEHA